VEFVGPARWWIEPVDQDQPIDGHLYFEVVVQNLSTRELTVGVSFRAYLADGTPYPGCFGPGGAGASTNVRPGEKAALFCTRTIAPLTLKSLQVTSRIEQAAPVEAIGAPAVHPSDVTLSNARADLYGKNSYTASTLLHLSGGKDIPTYVLFRFYDADDIQLETCTSGGVLVQPEIALKATCSGPVILPAAIARPSKVTAESRSPR
jgi:hypothetical protein